MKPHYYKDNYFEAEMSDLIGRKFINVSTNADKDELYFVCDEGTFTFYHDPDCCESVSIEDISGDLDDLIGTPILKAEESTSQENQEGLPVPEYQDDSFTWTFYKFATIKGYVDVRWYGSSNGYYSESVDLEFKKATV